MSTFFLSQFLVYYHLFTPRRYSFHSWSPFFLNNPLTLYQSHFLKREFDTYTSLNAPKFYDTNCKSKLHCQFTLPRFSNYYFLFSPQHVRKDDTAKNPSLQSKICVLLLICTISMLYLLLLLRPCTQDFNDLCNPVILSQSNHHAHEAIGCIFPPALSAFFQLGALFNLSVDTNQFFLCHVRRWNFTAPLFLTAHYVRRGLFPFLLKFVAFKTFSIFEKCAIPILSFLDCNALQHSSVFWKHIRPELPMEEFHRADAHFCFIRISTSFFRISRTKLRKVALMKFLLPLMGMPLTRGAPREPPSRHPSSHFTGGYSGINSQFLSFRQSLFTFGVLWGILEPWLSRERKLFVLDECFDSNSCSVQTVISSSLAQVLSPHWWQSWVARPG